MKLNSIKTTLVIGILALTTLVQAQRMKADEAGPKGQILLYGALNYTHTSVSGGSSSSNFNSVPFGVGYFINNNDVIGVNAMFSHNMPLNGATTKTNEMGIFYSPSVMIGDHFILILQVDADHIWGKDVSGNVMRAYPLLGVLCGHGWALKAKFGELSFNSIKSGNVRSNTFNSGFNGDFFGVGVSKTLNFHFKHKA